MASLLPQRTESDGFMTGYDSFSVVLLPYSYLLLLLRFIVPYLNVPCIRIPFVVPLCCLSNLRLELHFNLYCF